MQVKHVFSCLALAVFLTACTTYEVRTTDYSLAESLEVVTPDEYLLDVAIEILDPDLEGVPDDSLLFSQVREAETIWVAQKLKDTLENTNAWGAVRITPDDEVVMDIQIHGRIRQSDGEKMVLDITATDQTGHVWIAQQYEQVISRYAYDPSQRTYEPFQGLYNQIANDLLSALRQTTLEERRAIRSVSAIRFAQSFSPQAFDQYLVENEDGLLQVDRLPAENDPMLMRIQDIQARDQMFIDVLQDYYFGFSSNMDDPYHEWRTQSYQETQIIRELETSARQRRIAGWLSILAGTAASVEGNEYFATVGVVGIMGGIEELRASYAQRDEASLHIETLSELGQSLEEELAPSVIELQDRTITLTGTVRDQYEEWRELLATMYYAETGYLPPDEAEELSNTETSL